MLQRVLMVSLLVLCWLFIIAGALSLLQDVGVIQ
jgi:hypothetical protein